MNLVDVRRSYLSSSCGSVSVFNGATRVLALTKEVEVFCLEIYQE